MFSDFEFVFGHLRERDGREMFFISHAFLNPFSLVVEELKRKFRSRLRHQDVFVWLDIFAIKCDEQDPLFQSDVPICPISLSCFSIRFGLYELRCRFQMRNTVDISMVRRLVC